MSDIAKEFNIGNSTLKKYLVLNGIEIFPRKNKPSTVKTALLKLNTSTIQEISKNMEFVLKFQKIVKL